MKRSAPAAPLGGDANPQTGKGHGHTEFSNELLEAIYRFPFTGPQLRIVLAIIRDSYGWKRKVTRDMILMAWATELEMPHSTAHRAIAELKVLKVVEVDHTTGGFALVKNYRAWGKAPELELFTPGDKPVDNFPSLIGIPSVGNPISGNPTGGINPSTGEKKNPASGNGIGERKVKKKERGRHTADTPVPQVLPNGKNDSPRARAELGHPELPPENRPEFARLSFKLQDELTDAWKTSREDWVKRHACRKCRKNSKASETWSFCRPCSICSTCGAKANGATKFTARGDLITCTTCAPLPEAVPK